jgi:hypothetical protein
VGLAAGELIAPDDTEEGPPLAAEPAVKAALASARKAAERAAKSRGEQR